MQHPMQTTNPPFMALSLRSPEAEGGVAELAAEHRTTLEPFNAGMDLMTDVVLCSSFHPTNARTHTTFPLLQYNHPV